MTITEPITPTDIQYLLKRKGITQKDLAAKHGVHEMTISRVINGLMISNRLMKAIAREVGLKPEVAFAAYYSRPGRRRRASSSIN